MTDDLIRCLRNADIGVCDEAADEIEALQSFTRLVVERFHEDTPMGPNVVDLPDVRWRILPPTMAGAVRRALKGGEP